VRKLKEFYGEGPEGVEKLDLLIGTLCERDRPLMGFGQTLFAVFLQAASGRLERDPWFCKERFNDRYYTREGMNLINDANLKDIFMLHYPELKKSGLAGVNNALSRARRRRPRPMSTCSRRPAPRLSLERDAPCSALRMHDRQ
jgi:hypothetical protein